MLSKNLITYDRPKSPISEAYRMVRTNINYSAIDNKLQVIVVTSARQAEGKSTTAANIAITMAQSGQKVLIMDCDLRKPRLHKYFRMPNYEGLTTVMAGEIEFSQAVKHVEDIPNLDILSSGPIPPDPSEMLGSKKMKNFLNKLRDEYDYIIMDVPPVGQVTDGAVLGAVADGVMLAIACGQTNIEAAKNAKKILDKVNARVIGGVLTKVERSTSGYYYYNYDYSYYNYGEDSEHNNGSNNKKHHKRNKRKTSNVFYKRQKVKS